MAASSIEKFGLIIVIVPSEIPAKRQRETFAKKARNVREKTNVYR
jgi:hypothetical protein